MALIAALASGLTTTAERRTISAATYGHSLRQPLATLQMLVEDTLHKFKSAGQADLQPHLEHLISQTQLVVRLADQRRTYNRLRGIQNPREKIHLAALLHSCLKSWRTAADLKNVEVKFDLDESPYIVFGNKEDLEEALGNVFDNALRFSEPGQRIGVSLFGEQKEARIVIEDQGPGVTPGLRNRLFEPFVSTAHKGAPKGSGLGLAICYEVFVQHGGAIVYSEAEPRGASFCMTLPLVCDEVPGRAGGASD
ncbi:MAG: HAMP domain-containing histidine kinase [Acidobacteria bacterium]|nr:HAMP domain-containing histidine kinase [Acidobacteriota bacterium]